MSLLRKIPLDWVVAGLLLVGFLLLCLWAANGLGIRFDPFHSTERRLDQAVASAATAMSNAGARSAEAAGANDTTNKVETAQARIRAADAVIARTTPAAKAVPDADQDLEADRLAHHNDVTRQLCELRPSVCPGFTPAARDAGDSRAIVSADLPAARGVPI